MNSERKVNLSFKDREIARLLGEIDELKEEFNEIEAKVSQEIASKDVTINTSTNKIRSLEQLYENLKEDYDKLKKDYQLKTEENFELQMQLNTNEPIEEADESVESQPSDFDQVVRAQQLKIAELEQELYSARNIIGLKNRAIEETRNCYQSQIKQLNKTVEQYNNLLSQVKNECNS